MKTCAYCNFENPEEALSCLSCKQRFERQCPYCNSWRVLHGTLGYKCLNCQKVFQSEDVPNEGREELENKLLGSYDRLKRARTEGQPVSLGEALSPFKDLVTGAVKQTVDNVKVQNDSQWVAKAQVHSLKRGFTYKILYTVLGLIALFCGAIGYLIGREQVAFLFFIIGMIISLIFIRPKLSGFLKKTFFNQS